MPFFYNNNSEDELLNENEEFDMDSFMEMCFFMEASGLPEEQRKAIVESEEAAIYEAKGLIGKKTFIRLSKQDDLGRRQSAAAYQMAKDNNDPLWRKLVFHIGKKNEFKQKILKKYGPKAQKIAKKSQKEFLKHPNSKLITKKDLTDTREKAEKK